jgi:septal ring factor EnvC (AmiA/AmiB activator)
MEISSEQIDQVVNKFINVKDKLNEADAISLKLQEILHELRNQITETTNKLYRLQNWKNE